MAIVNVAEYTVNVPIHSSMFSASYVTRPYAWLLLAVAGCSGPDEDDAGGIWATFDATKLGAPEDARVTVFPPGAVPALESEAAVAEATTGTSLEVASGAWVAHLGQYIGPNGFYQGQAIHRDEDGQFWIAPAYSFEGEAGEEIEHTFTLNFLVDGWWECCLDGATLCGADQVDYSGGRVAQLPWFDVEVDGMDFHGVDENGETVGAFVDARRAFAVVQPPQGDPFDVWCCESGYCEPGEGW